MSRDGRRSLNVISSMHSSVESQGFWSYNSDNGIKIGGGKGNSRAIQSKRMKVGDILSSDQLHKNVTDTIPLNLKNTINKSNIYNRGLDFNPSDIGVSEDIFKLNGYNREDFLDYKKRMEAIESGKGALYSFDIETMGDNALLNKKALVENKQNYAITEATLWKTYKKDGDWIKERVFGLSSSPNNPGLSYAELVETKNADNTLNVMLSRIVGYSGNDSVVKSEKTGEYMVNRWYDNQDISDFSLGNRGIDNLKKLNKRGSKENIDQMTKFVNFLADSVNDENSMLTTINGLSFDIPHVLAEAKHLGIDTTRLVEGLEKGGHYDVQKVRQALGRKENFDQARAARVAGVEGVTDSFGLENRTEINKHRNPAMASEIESRFGGGYAHTADYDTFVSLFESISTYEDVKGELDNIEKMHGSSLDIGNDTVFISNSNFMSDKNSMHFKVENGVVNSYNSSIINRDGIYKIRSSKVKSAKDIKKVIGEKNAEAFEGLEEKTLFELEDVLNPENKVMMFYDSAEKFQEDLVDSKVLSPIKLTNENLELYKKSFEMEMMDKARRDIEGFGSASSWKKVDRLSSYLTQYNELKDFTVDDIGGVRRLKSEEINTLLSNKPIDVNGRAYNPNEVFSVLSKEWDVEGKKEVRVTPENLKTMKEIYSDLESNGNLYSEIISTVTDNVASNEYIETFESKSKSHRIASNRTENATKAFGGVIDDIEQEILGSITDVEKLEYIVKNDSVMDKHYQESVRELGGKMPNNIQKEEFMKNAYKHRFREEFDVDSRRVEALVRDKVELKTRNIVSSIDVLSTDEGYTSLPFKDPKEFENRLSMTVNKVGDKVHEPMATTRDRLKYADDIANDMFGRGLLKENDLDMVLNADTVQGKVTQISEQIQRNKNKAEEIIKTSIADIKGINSVDEALLAGYRGLKNLYDKDRTSKEAFDEAFPFIHNRIMNEKWTTNKRTIMGKSIQEHVNARGIDVKGISKEQAKIKASGVTILGDISTIEDVKLREIYGDMYSELQWDDKHIDRFEKIIKNKNLNSNIKMNRDGKNKSLSKFVVKDHNEDYHLLITDSGKTVENRIAKGDSIEKLSQRAVSFKLPKIENNHGTKMISQSDIAKKLVSDTLIMDPKTNVYSTMDTVEEVLDGFDSSLYYVKERMADKDYKGANKRSGRAWNSINESKALTAKSTKYVDINGKLGVDIVFGINRADAAKSTLVNNTALVYELPTAFKKSPEFEAKFMNFFSKSSGNDHMALSLIKMLSDDSNAVKTSMDKLGNVGIQLSMFLRPNISEFAGILLSDEDFIKERGFNIKGHLEDLSKFGDAAIVVKPSDAVKGYMNTQGVHTQVPFSNFSNTARETMLQSMNGFNIYEDSIETAYKHKIGNVEGIDKIYEDLKIRRGFGVINPDTLKLSKSFREESGGLLGFTTEAKHLTSEEFNKKLMGIRDSDALQQKIKEVILTKHGIKASSEELQQAIKIVSQTTSLYEDSGMVNIKLAEVMNPAGVTSEKVYTPNSKLKIGDNVKIDDLLGFDIDGQEVFSKDNGIIGNIKDDSVLIQINGDGASFKANINHSEKAVLVSPSFKKVNPEVDKRMMNLISEVQYAITDGANIAINAGVKKHDAFNVVAIPTHIAIADAIQNDEEANFVRKVFKENAHNLDIDIVNNGDRYVMVNNPRITELKNVNPIEDMEKVKSILKADKSELGKRVTNNLNRIDEKLGMVDVVLASNNTIERGMNGKGQGSGVATSSRMWASDGLYREFDDIGQVLDGSTYLTSIIDEEMNMILNANKEGSREVSNIYNALKSAYDGSVPEKVKIKDVKLGEIIVPNGVVEADRLDDIFRFTDDVNLYKIDLSELGLAVDNPLHIKKGEVRNANQARRLGKLKDRITEVYIPVSSPNRQGSEATLSKSQKSIADFIKSIQEAKYIPQGSKLSPKQSFDNIENKYKDMLKSFHFDMTHKDGLRYKIQSTKKNPGSFRAEAHKIIAPTINSDGTLNDIAFGHKITKIDKNGKFNYTSSVFVNEQQLRDLGLNFEKLGEDILTKQTTEAHEEQVELIRNILSESTSRDYSHIKDLKEIQKIARGIADRDKVASAYLEKIGFEGMASRDPIIRLESRTGVIFRTGNGIAYGGMAMDPITADGAKADSDGDKINAMLKGLTVDEEGDLVLRDYNDEIRKGLRKDAIGRSDSSFIRLQELSKNELKKSTENKNMFSLGEYYEFSSIKDLIGSGDTSYISNETAKTVQTNASLSKGLVGQASNPGLHLKIASSEYVASLSKYNPELARKVNKSIGIGALLTEQNAIDQKLNKFGAEAMEKSTKHMINAMNMGDGFNNLFKSVRRGNEDEIRRSVSTVIEILENNVKENSEAGSLALYWQDGKNPQGRNYTEQIDNIIKGNIKRSNVINNATLEEYLYDTIKVFKDDKSAELYTSIFTSRSEKAVGQKGFETFVEKIGRVVNAKGQTGFDSHAVQLAIKQMTDAYETNNLKIGEDFLKPGDNIFVNNNGDKLKANIYKIKSAYERDGIHTVELLDAIDKNKTQVYKMTGSDVGVLNTSFIRHGATKIEENELPTAISQLINIHKSNVEEDILSSRDLLDKHISTNERFVKSTKAFKPYDELASHITLGEYNINYLKDMHDTLDVLSEKYNVGKRSDVLKEMNDAIKSRGTKDYQVAKREALLGIPDIKRFANTNMSAFMRDLEVEVRNRNVKKAKLNVVKDIINSNKRINMKAVKGSGDLTNYIQELIDASGVNLNSGELETVMTNSREAVLGDIKKVDDGVFGKLNSAFKENQHNTEFLKEVLGWDIEGVENLLDNNDNIKAINKLNESTIIFSRDYSGKKMGELSLSELKHVLDISDNTGISDDVVRANKTMVHKLITLRANNDIMLDEVVEPMVKNFKDSIPSKTIDNINKNIVDKGKMWKRASTESTAASVSGFLDGVKSKLAGMTNKQKITVAAATALGVGATMAIGNNISRNRASLKNREVESNLTNKHIPKAPPTEKKIYVSDNNAIKVNVRGRQPIGKSSESATTALSSVLGSNVDLNTTISDSREFIQDYEIDNIMDKSLK